MSPACESRSLVRHFSPPTCFGDAFIATNSGVAADKLENDQLERKISVFII